MLDVSRYKNVCIVFDGMVVCGCELEFFGWIFLFFGLVFFYECFDMEILVVFCFVDF